jgi:hypothetical protein
MIFQFLNKQFELSKDDATVWLDQWTEKRIEQRGHRQVLPGRCCFCEKFHIERKGYENSCTECPLKIYGIEGQHRVEGCLTLLESILGPKGDNSLTAWGLIFHKEYTVIWGDKGLESCRKIRQAIIESVINKEDRDGIGQYFTESKPEFEEDENTEG